MTPPDIIPTANQESRTLISPREGYINRLDLSFLPSFLIMFFDLKIYTSSSFEAFSFFSVFH